MDSWSTAPYSRDERAQTRLTLDEWIALPGDELGELVAGELRMEEVPSLVHSLAVSWLIAMLRAWLGTGRGFVFDSEVKVALSPTSGRKPDISVVLPGRSLSEQRGALRVPPDLVVEVVTPTPRDERRDRIEKMEEYAAFGIAYYWLLDPALGSLEVFELRDGHYARVHAATEGVLTHIAGCPGLTLSLDELWAELSRLSAD